MNEAFESELHRESTGEVSEGSTRGSDADELKPAEAAVASRRRRPPIWPFITYFSLISILVAAIAAWIQHTASAVNYLMMVMSAGMFGLAALLGMIAGLWGRCWLAGFWLAWLLATVGALAIALAVQYDYMSAEDVLERFVIAFMVPAVVFALAAPHLLMRSLCGWRLDRSDRPFQQKRSGGLLDLMALVTVLASVSFLLRVPLVIWEERPADYFFGIGMAAAMFFVVSMLLVVPSVKFAFRGRTRLRRWGLPIAILLLGMGSVFATMERIEKSSWSDIEWKPILIFAPVATAVFLIGLATFKIAGFGLVRNLRASNRHIVVEDDPLLQPARLRALHIRWAAGTLLIAVVTSVVLNVQVSRRNRQDAELAQLAERLRGAGGDLSVQNRMPQRAKIADTADPADLLAELSRHGGLTDLSLAGSRVDDALLIQLPQWFPGLEKLDLGHTGVTAEGLRHLLPLSDLESLGLSGTDLTIDQMNAFIREYTKQGREIELDLSDTQLDAEAIGQLDKRIDQLAIRRLGFSDTDLTCVHDRHFASLDISGNPVAGHGLAKMKIYELVAHDVPLTDDGLRAFLGDPNTSVNTLVISNTRLTDASATLLLGVEELHLGDGTISDDALAANATSLHTLGLHGKQFTGESLHELVTNINVQYLDLSGSGVTDQALIDLGASLRQANAHILGLGLADTEITDRGIQGLDNSGISELDLRRTGVTAAGVSEMQMQYSLYVDLNQFTPQQLDMLRQHHRVVVGREPWWSNFDDN